MRCNLVPKFAITSRNIADASAGTTRWSMTSASLMVTGRPRKSTTPARRVEAQIRGEPSARQHALPDPAAGNPLTEQVLGTRRGPDGTGETDRNAVGLFRLPPPGACRLGRGDRSFQRKSGPVSARAGGADSEGAEEQTRGTPTRLFLRQMHQSVNPNLLEAAVEETLIQHFSSSGSFASSSTVASAVILPTSGSPASTASKPSSATSSLATPTAPTISNISCDCSPR